MTITCSDHLGITGLSLTHLHIFRHEPPVFYRTAPPVRLVSPSFPMLGSEPTNVLCIGLRGMAGQCTEDAGTPSLSWGRNMQARKGLHALAQNQAALLLARLQNLLQGVVSGL